MDRIKKISLILFFISGSCYAQRVEAVKAVGKYYLSGGVQTPKILNYINLGGIAFSIGFELKDRRLVRKFRILKRQKKILKLQGMAYNKKILSSGGSNYGTGLYKRWEYAPDAFFIYGKRTKQIEEKKIKAKQSKAVH